jgi:hypothetical protein
MARVLATKAELLAATDKVEYTLVRWAAQTHKREVQRLMRSSPASGRVYLRGGRAHRASAPGEPPAVDTGTLVRNVEAIVGRQGGGWVGETGVLAEAEYAMALEYGTARMAPRPAWRPALQRVIAEAPAVFAGKGTLGMESLGGAE